MTTILNTREPGERLDKTSTDEHATSLEALFPSLLKKIKEGTLTIEEIDSFLRGGAEIPPKLNGYLLNKKAWLLLRGGQGEEALHQYDRALSINPGSAVTWALKGAAFLELNQVEKAFQAYEQAYSHRENFGSQKEGYLRDLFMGWSLASLFLGLEGILNQDSAKVQRGVQEYLAVLERAQSEDLLSAAVTKLETDGTLDKHDEDAIEELMLAIKLLSIKDPFERARALAKEVTKVWPEGVSAVEAVREQRDREWNP